MKLISERELEFIFKLINPNIDEVKLKDIINSYPDYTVKEFDNYNYD